MGGERVWSGVKSAARVGGRVGEEKGGGKKKNPQAPAFSYLQARVISLMPQTVNYKNLITAIFGSMAW